MSTKVVKNKIKTLVNSIIFSIYKILVTNIRISSLATIGDIVEVIKELVL